MPELPEVEHVRRTLEPAIVGRLVTGVALRRRDIVTGPIDPASLLVGDQVVALRRRGKQLAIVGQSGRAVLVHLGMTGRLLVRPGEEGNHAPAHTHVVWSVQGPGADGQAGDPSQVLFVDPRRFGGLWTMPSAAAIDQRWAELGPDALTIGPATLHDRLTRTTRALKAALLDQQLVAGLGNIYVDELLFDCRLAPTQRADQIDRPTAHRLVRAMRRILHRSIEAGGSTLRDYVDARGAAGAYQNRHRVYGRQGQRCPRPGCSALLVTTTIAGRTTTWCPRCQRG